jgi:DNA-binding MarR family transcriptional regulator
MNNQIEFGEIREENQDEEKRKSTNYLYDFKTGEYVYTKDLTKDGSRFIKRHRKKIIPDEFIDEHGDKRSYTDEYPDKQRYTKDFPNIDIMRKEFLKTLDHKEICICLLSEYGYRQQEIAEIIKTSQKTISNRLKELEKKYNNFLK